MAGLTTKQLEVLNGKPGDRRRIWDSGGLYVDISPNGVISFAMKYRRDGKERREGFGRFPAVKLDEARKKAREIRVALDRKQLPPRGGGDLVTFEDAATEWMKVNDSRLSERSMVQVRRYLNACIDGFGAMKLDEVRAPDVLTVLRKFEARKAFESAKRARIYCAAVFDFAIALGRAQNNPAAPLKTKGILRQRPGVVHHAAMPAKDIPDFLKKLAAANIHPSIRGALAFVVLTALRTGEVLELRWADIAADGKSLTIPAERMKAGRAHKVFLSTQARRVLDSIREFSDGREHVFPGRDPKGPLSNMAMLMSLNRLVEGVTVHGFRSSFSTWANANGADPNIVERCLAHASGDKIAAAYNRYGFDREAAELWQRWADAIDPVKKRTGK